VVPSFFSSMRRMFAARLVPASRLARHRCQGICERFDARTMRSRSSGLRPVGEDRIDEVVARPLIAKLDFEAVEEEGEKINYFFFEQTFISGDDIVDGSTAFTAPATLSP